MYSKASVYTHHRKNRKKALISFTVILLVSVLAALGAAIYWEKVQQQKQDELMMQAEQNTDLPKETPTQQTPEPETEQTAALAENKKEDMQEKPEEELPQSSAESQEMPKEPEIKEEKVPEDNQEHAALVTSERILNSTALVPYSGTRVGDDYFDDVAFVGDSITEGIKLYDLMSNSTVVAARGINLDSVFTDDKIRTTEGNTTVMKALSAADPQKIYIMFGANGVGWYTEEHFNQVYTKFVQAVEKQHPDSQIFLQSILPVTQKFDDNRDDISNKKIDRYNEIIVGIAEAEGVYYLDVASVFKDDKGCLPEDSNGDGMHFGGVYYQKWFDYLRTHTVSETEEEPKPSEESDIQEKQEDKKEPETEEKSEQEEQKTSSYSKDSQRDPERKPKVKPKKPSKD